MFVPRFARDSSLASIKCWRAARATLLVLFCSACLSVACLPHAQAAPQSGRGRDLTVERIYSAPGLGGARLGEVIWSPDGKWLSYLTQNEIRGVDAATGRRQTLVDADHLRNVLLPAASRGQQTGLGRVAPARYLWSPDSRALLFVSAEELFWYDLKSQTSKRIAGPLVKNAGADTTSDDGNTIDDVQISPDGRSVAFVRDHDLWITNVADGAARQLTTGGTEERPNAELDWVYPEELDLHTGYWWSPDSSQIAFLQLDESAVGRYPLVDDLSYQGKLTEERYPIAGSPNPTARVGVASVAVAATSSGAEVHWMDTGTDSSVLLARVAWLQDSRRIAIERLNRAQTRLDLLFADTASGKAQIAFTETDKYWVNVNDDLRFLADQKRFLWSSERSGYRHLYLYDLDGKQLAQVTSGDWEVEGIAGVNEKDAQIYFTSTQKSAIERQFYRVPLSGGEPVALTHDRGTHSVNLAPDCKHFLDSYSSAMTPPRQTLYNADGGTVAVLNENKVPELASYRMSPVEFLTVPGADGTPLDAALIKPVGFDPARKYPVIVHLYGGPGAQEVRDAWQGQDFLWHELMAEKGFLIFILDNRGTSGRGHVFETPIYHHFGRVELADQLAGVDWLKRQSYVDRARIGIWGWSYGGYMTCVAMLRAGDVFKAGFAGAPVTDWRQYDTIYTERYMGTPQENPDGYADSSPVNFASGLQGKLLIVHATGDDNVHFANTVELADKFVDAGKYAEYQIYAGRGHGISDAPARIHIFDRVTQFFVENLMK
jgi:dipeptidyl-peptidase 4